jgi:hypothetical protein
MNILILSSAEEEFAEAVDYYNGQCPGLGYEFAVEVNHTFDRIKVYPEAWQLFSKRTRRCLLNRFPYGVLYRVDTGIILVGAIMHLNRDPKTWDLRTGKF